MGCSSSVFICELLWILLFIINANEELSPSWRPLPYGECTNIVPTPSTTAAVGLSGGGGNTCGFDSFPSTSMPTEFQIGNTMMIGQDVYNGFHTQDDFDLDCVVGDKSSTNSSNDCGQACGVCFRVSGPNGDNTYIVQQIADITNQVRFVLYIFADNFFVLNHK